MCQLTDKFIMKTHLGKGWHQTKPWGSCGVLGCNICSIKLHSDAPIPRLFATALWCLKQLLTSPGHTSLDTDPQRPNVSVNSPRHNQLKKVVKICHPLTLWKKKSLNKLHAMFICHVRFAFVDLFTRYWIWHPSEILNLPLEPTYFLCYEPHFGNLANVKIPSITSGSASHDITETDSESSICCYHP